MFSDLASKVAERILLRSLDPGDVIRIYSASDEGVACIQTQPSAPERCFSSLEFKVYLCLRSGIQIARENRKCNNPHPLCKQKTELSNLHLVNGCNHGDYVHRKHNVDMDEISKLCRAANILVESESSFCFNDHMSKRMDLFIKFDNKDILIDATFGKDEQKFY